MTEKKRTIFLHTKSFKDFKNDLIDQGKDFEVNQSGYTSIITGHDLPFNYMFSTSGKNMRCIYLNAKIKSAIKNSNIHIDEVKTDKIKYFDLSNLTPCSKKIVYNIDIRSAYPKQLQNFGFIDKELFDYMHKPGIKKKERLKAIGMIATKKTLSIYKEGKLVPPLIYSQQSTRNIFFAVCEEVGECIELCKLKAKDSFLFYWFDGIYFTNKKYIKPIGEILTNCGFEYKVEKLEKFYCNKSPRIVYIAYEKEGKQKRFIMPINQSNNNEIK
jgi:hypothetical protein